MSTEALLKQFVELYDDVRKHGPTSRWRVLRQFSTILMDVYDIRLLFEEVESTPKTRRLTNTDLQNLAEAAAVNRKIREYLSQKKKSGGKAKKANAASKRATTRPRAAKKRSDRTNAEKKSKS